MPLRDSHFHAPSAHLMRTCLIGLCVGVLSLSGAFVLPAQAAENAAQDPAATITQETGESASTHPEQPADGNSASQAPAEGAPAANGSDSAAGGTDADGALAGGAFAGAAFAGGARSGEGILGETAEELESAAPSPAPDADDASTNTAGGADNAADQDQSQDLTNEQTTPAAEAANMPAALSHTSPFRNAAGVQGNNFTCGGEITYFLDRSGGIHATPWRGSGYELEQQAPPIPGLAPDSTMDALAVNGDGSLAVAVESGGPVSPGYEGSYRLWVYRPQSGEWQAMLNQQNQDQPNNRDHPEPFTVGAIAPDGQRFIFGYFKTRRSASDPIELVLKANNPGNPQVTEQSTIVLPWPEATGLEFDGDIVFDARNNLYVAVGEKDGDKAGTFMISSDDWEGGNPQGVYQMASKAREVGTVWGFALRSKVPPLIGADREYGQTTYGAEVLGLMPRSPHGTGTLGGGRGVRKTDMSSCDQPPMLRLTLKLNATYRTQDVPSLVLQPRRDGGPMSKVPIVSDITERDVRRLEFISLPVTFSYFYYFKPQFNGGDDDSKYYYTNWRCRTGNVGRGVSLGEVLELRLENDLKNNTLECEGMSQSAVGVAFRTTDGRSLTYSSVWQVQRVGSAGPPIIAQDCIGFCSKGDINLGAGHFLIQLPEYGEYVMRQVTEPTGAFPHTQEYRFTLTPEQPTADLGEIVHRPARSSISMAVNAVKQPGGPTVTEGLSDWSLSVLLEEHPYYRWASVNGRQVATQNTDDHGRLPHSWEFKETRPTVPGNLKVGHNLRAGYKPVDLRCVKRGEGGENLGETVYPTTDIQPTDGYIYVILESVSTATDLDCTFTVYRDSGTVEWRTVDAADQHAHLPGTEWLVTPQGKDGIAISDCVADGQCGNTRDVDPRPGYIRIVGLESSEYTLSQTSAPAGYFPSRDAQRTFRVDAANQEVDLGQFEHAAYPEIPLPMTGGSSADIFVFAGMLSLVLAGVIALRGNPVHPLRMVACRRG